MFLDRIFKFPTSKTKRICAVVIVLSVVGVVHYNVEIFSTTSKVMYGSILPKWYSVNLSVGRPRFFSPQDAFKEVPNLPTAYLDPMFNRIKYRVNETCAQYPDVFKLSFHNLYWQSFRLSSNTWYLFSAYYENRPLSDVKPAVRVLVAINRFNQKTPFCQLWYRRQQRPVIVRVARSEPVWKHFSILKKYVDEIEEIFMITCPIPATHASLVPDSVSLVEHKCDTARNHLKVIYNKAKKKRDFAVCATPLNFIGVDYSVRFVEWIEMVHLLGADKIFLYYLHHHRNVSKVLKHYEEKGLVQSTHFSLAGGQPNLPLLQNLYLHGVGEYVTNQLLVQQDCLYRNMYNYEYIAIMDIDEMIMPLAASTWKDLLKDVPQYWRKQATSFCVVNYWFYDDDTYPSQNYSDVPFYLHMLKHVHRTNTVEMGQGKYPIHVKCFHVPEKIKIEGNHRPISCFGGCKTYLFPPMKGQLQHYCDQQISNRCSGKENISVLDTNIWRYKTALIEKVLPTLNKLGFLNL